MLVGQAHTESAGILDIFEAHVGLVVFEFQIENSSRGTLLFRFLLTISILLKLSSTPSAVAAPSVFTHPRGALQSAPPCELVLKAMGACGRSLALSRPGGEGRYSDQMRCPAALLLQAYYEANMVIVVSSELLC